MPSHSGLLRQASAFGEGGRGGLGGSDVTLNSNENYVVVTTAGDLTIVPINNDDSDSITFVSAPVGFVPPFKVKTIVAATTTAVVATIRRPSGV